ncbi:MAG: AIR synthase-related protein, partial [Alphaproteobacteria bacterium]
GGLLVALAEMAMAANMGATLTSATAKGDIPLHAWLFGEDQARYLISTEDGSAVVVAAHEAGVPAQIIGRTGGAILTLDEDYTISIEALRAAHEAWLPEYMATP